MARSRRPKLTPLRRVQARGGGRGGGREERRRPRVISKGVFRRDGHRATEDDAQRDPTRAGARIDPVRDGLADRFDATEDATLAGVALDRAREARDEPIDWQREEVSERGRGRFERRTGCTVRLADCQKRGMGWVSPKSSKERPRQGFRFRPTVSPNLHDEEGCISRPVAALRAQRSVSECCPKSTIRTRLLTDVQSSFAGLSVRNLCCCWQSHANEASDGSTTMANPNLARVR